MKVAALFAGIAGVELGLKAAGHQTLMFCENYLGAQAVLQEHFPKIPLVPDVRDLTHLPGGTQVVTAGFPCQDLSQAGGTKGINGSKSGVVHHLFKILQENDVPHVLIENVPFMLQLQKGEAINYLVTRLERLGYSWAYRVVDARCFGLPQRRERVFLIASKKAKPWNVLFREGAEPIKPKYSPELACGFYWTEGTRGLGWAVDAVPTLKGGSTVGIASPPGIWMPDGRIVTPTIIDAERMQGFAPNWTLPAERVVRKGMRWKLVGNAVSVKAAAWVGECLANLHRAKDMKLDILRLEEKHSWPSAAYGLSTGERYSLKISKWPRTEPQIGLCEFLSEPPKDLSYKAVDGFIRRLTTGNLRYEKGFLDALLAHRNRMASLKEVA